MKNKYTHSASGARSAPDDRPSRPRQGKAAAPGKRSANDILAEEGLPPRGSARTNLRPISDQLIALAEQLRKEALRSERGSDCDRPALLGSVAAITPQGTPFEQRASVDYSHIARQKAHSAPCAQKAGRLREFYAELARELYEQRRRRNSIFGNAELFGEPAWDILLDLYVAHAKGEPVSVSSACIGSAAPPTTGLRWLGVLAEQGLTLREHDPDDQRRVLVRLTERGLEAMDAFFALIAGDVSIGEDQAD